MSYWKTDDFKALQKAWYERLEKSGFHDAEVVREDELYLKKKAKNPYKNMTKEQVEEKTAYFRLLYETAQNAFFDRDIDEICLIMYAEGKNKKEIRDVLEKIGKVRCRWAILHIIRKYEMRWGLREYSRREFGLRERK
jgi:hypothetical protein